MFDWNEEELTNIIWDEAGESGDHIVPYTDASRDYCKKKDWSQEADNTKTNKQKPLGTEVDIHGRKLQSSSNFDSNEGASAAGFGIESWPNLSLSTAANTDQDSLDTSVSNNLTETTNFGSSGGAEAVQLDKDFQKGKEQGEFIDYGWANIGSFEDLDQIFGNDDPIFGSASLSNGDELWTSSKDATYSTGKSFPIYPDSSTLGLEPLRNTSEYFENKTEYAQEDNHPFTLDYGLLNDPASHSLHNACNVLDHVEYAGDQNKARVKNQTDMTIMGKNTTTNSQLTAENAAALNLLPNKVYKKKKPLRSRKKLEQQSQLALYHDLYGEWSSAGNLPSQYKKRFAPTLLRSSPSVLSQPRELQGPESFQYQQISDPLVASSAYGTITNPYSAMPVLSHIHSGEFKQQSLLSGYEVSSGNANTVEKLSDSLMKRQTMTPQEKIEKLRKRQQMQAMLAIKKQQQQLGHQVPCSDHSITQNCSQENQMQLVEGTDLEVDDLSTFPAFDPNSPIEQDDSNTITQAVKDYSAEDTLFYRLQDIIAKLDVRIRLCIRDSLLRLAQSARQRHFTSDTSTTNNSSRDEQVVTKEESSVHNRNAKMSEAETETNPIDRNVAHLLFHRPLELSGKHPDAPESPASAKLPGEQQASKPSMGCLPETLKYKEIYPNKGYKMCSLADPHSVSQCNSSVCIDNSVNSSNNGPTNEGFKDIEASQ